MYKEKVFNNLNKVKELNEKSFNVASDMIVKSIKEDGLIYIFGSGHSHIMAEEMFYRPGGLFNIYPIFYEPLMVHNGPIISSVYEKQEKFHEKFINKYKIKQNDILIVISTSGVNPTPIEIAKYAKERKAKIIVISSKKYYRKINSRHKDGIYLGDLADVFIDNNIEIGDNAIYNKNKNVSYGSLSTITGVFIVDMLTNNSIEKLLNNNFDVPIVLSPNIEGAIEKNSKNLKKYSKRIECLK